ncbi:MAG: SpoIIE family protein phosphatase [Candidatus Cloacimonadales bacterium]
MKISSNFFVELKQAQRFKQGQIVCGDNILIRRLKSQNRILGVLSDGLGSGVKANVLSSLTASMAMKYATNDSDLALAARTIMDTLPVDDERQISYSTFTILDIDFWGNCSVVEYDNPRFVLMRNGKEQQVECEISEGYLDKAERKYELYISKFKLEMNDRIVFYSDGVSQSGIGSERYPFGWEREQIVQFLEYLLGKFPRITAAAISDQIVEHAYANSQYRAVDDISCVALNIRKPHQLLVVTGPSVKMENDVVMAQRIGQHQGKTAVCGGTTASIIARELQAEIEMNLEAIDPEVPCYSKMAGVNLITEGMLTLAKAIEILQEDCPESEMQKDNGAVKLLKLFFECDIIEFLVGTRINEVHQDPNMPLELGIRRNTIKNLARLLEEKKLKEIKVEYI